MQTNLGQLLEAEAHPLQPVFMKEIKRQFPSHSPSERMAIMFRATRLLSEHQGSERSLISDIVSPQEHVRALAIWLAPFIKPEMLVDEIASTRAKATLAIGLYGEEML